MAPRGDKLQFLFSRFLVGALSQSGAYPLEGSRDGRRVPEEATAPTRRQLRLDIDDIRAVNPSIVYACGTGQGFGRGRRPKRAGTTPSAFGPRGGVGATVTPPGAKRPIGQPAGAFGDSLSGMALAGGVAAALFRRARTGEGSVVDVALLGTAMWCLQMPIVGAAVMMAQQPAGDGERPSSRSANPQTSIPW